jgi:hypothetical protein
MKTFKVIAVTILVTLFGINYSQAISVDFVPSNQTVKLGQKVVVYLHISGLEPGDPEDQKVGAFDIDIGFDNQILKFKKVQFGSQLGDPSDDNETNANLLMDYINDGWFGISEVSKLTPAELNQLQDFCVTVVKIVFRAKKVGKASVYGDGYYVDDQNGNTILGIGGNFSPESATVNVVKRKRFLPSPF